MIYLLFIVSTCLYKFSHLKVCCICYYKYFWEYGIDYCIAGNFLRDNNYDVFMDFNLSSHIETLKFGYKITVLVNELVP